MGDMFVPICLFILSIFCFILSAIGKLKSISSFELFIFGIGLLSFFGNILFLINLVCHYNERVYAMHILFFVVFSIWTWYR